MIETESYIEPFKKIIFDSLSIKISGKTILDEVSGYAQEGQMLALMGKSGSGKTSFLNYITHRRELLGADSSEIKGKVFFDGHLMKKSDRKKIGYMMQEEIFFENFTLKETINFYAKLLLPNEMSMTEKKNKVMEILESLELTHVMNTVIGGSLVRGLSGGEKKRANIAVELLTDPDVLILDEPTSGLDSGMAAHLIKLLKKLAVEKNKTIIAAIHQPSSQVFFMFDKLLLLSHGKVAYFGEIFKVDQFFDLVGFPCEKNWNIADHMIDILSNEKDRESKIIDFYESISVCESLEPKIKQESDMKRKIKKCSYFNQIKALSRRSLSCSANANFNIINLVRYLLISLLIGAVFFQTGFYVQNMTNSLGLLFYSTLQNMMNPMFTNLLQFGPELTVIRKERMSKMYKLSAYFIGKVVVESVFVVIRPTLTWTILYFLTGLTPSWYFILSLLTNFLFASVCQSLGFFISSFGMTFAESVGLCSAVFTSWILVAGFYNNHLPIFISWAKYISPIYYGYALQVWIQLLANNGAPCLKKSFIKNNNFDFNNLCKNNQTSVSISDVLTKLSFSQHPEYYYGVGFGAIFMFNLLTYFTLRRTLSRIQKRKSVVERLIDKLKGK